MTEEAEKCAPQATIFTNENATIETTSVNKEEKIVDINSCPERGPEEEYSPRYAKFIVKHPYIIIGFISLLVVLSGAFSLIPQLGAPPLPDFNDPIKGFEARGTVISHRLRSQLNLFRDEQNGGVTRVPCPGINNPVSEQKIGDAPAVCTRLLTISQGKLTTKFVFATKSGKNLLTAENLKSACRLENKIIRDDSNFDDHCHKANGTKDCCPSWSLGNYIALLNGKSSCPSIDEADVKNGLALLQACSRYYNEEKLKPDCWDFAKDSKRTGRCDEVPPKCARFNAVFNILHYLTDKSFLANGTRTTFLRYGLTLVPVKESKRFQVDIYNSRLKDADLSDGDVEVSGYEMSVLKYAIFNERMIIDLYLAAIAMVIVMIILWVYTRSLIITSLVGLIVVSSLIIAYFIYTKVLAMEFFPFLNILTSVFLVGIAADDAFVYLDIWNQSTREHREKRARGHPPSNEDERERELICVTADTMKHASLSMFVTSFTTSAAFFSSLSSEITSIRLFGLYSGLSILCMFSLMVTWFPAVVVLEQTVFSRCDCCSRFCCRAQGTAAQGACSARTIVDKLIELHRRFFTSFLPRIVIKLRYFSAVFLFLIAVGSIVISTFKPGLQLPTSQDLQMFRKSHALEKYPLKLKKNFHFETTKRKSFSVNFVWGIKAIDTGDPFDPHDTGSLKWDDNFNIESPEAQRWIDGFTSRLKKQSFFAKDQKPSFMEEFSGYMRSNCTNTSKICCADSIPYNSSVFSYCLKKMQCERVMKIQFSGESITDGAPLFDEKTLQLRAMSLKFDSTVPFTWSYDPVDRFWRETESWSEREFDKSPRSANGWFISELQFYDLQKSLSRGTFVSMSISLAVAFAVMLVTTGNVYISVLATITITCALGVTVGSLVLMGWKLNVLESITLSVAVGLCVDFTLHYGVAYVLAVDKTERRFRAHVSVTCMSSAITMAAVTTFIAGAVSTQSVLLSYLQMGQFLMIIMSVSWVYGTFFFQALCSILGPQNDSGQMTLYKLKARCRRMKARLCCVKEVGAEEQVAARVIYMKKRTEVG